MVFQNGDFGELWSSAFEAARKQFEVDELYHQQKEGIRNFFKHKRVFVNLPTGFGKSLIFQCLPLVADVLFQRDLGTSILIVISPLKYLIQDQINYLDNLGFPVTSLTECEDPEVVQQVFNGMFNIVYTSPESLLQNFHWRELFKTQLFKNRFLRFVIDEAHVVTQWYVLSFNNVILN